MEIYEFIQSKQMNIKEYEISLKYGGRYSTPAHHEMALQLPPTP